MDPMTELFYDESNDILQQLRRDMVVCKGKPAYGQDVVQSVFRGVHTLKASSTMMLFENLSEISKAMEQLLFCFRGEGKEITDTEKFDEILVSYLEFFEQETDKLSAGKQPEGQAGELEEKIRSYTEELTGQMEAGEMEAYQKQLTQPKRQMYYIAGVTQEEQEASGRPGRGQEERGAGARQPKPKEKPAFWRDSFVERQQDVKAEAFGGQPGSGRQEDTSPKRYILSENKREVIFRAARNLQRITSALEYSVDESGKGEFTLEQLERLREIERDLLWVKKYLTKADFVPVAKKMKVVVDEMSMKLGKNVRLLVKGEQTPIDYEMRDKISNALLHLIRNAVDHGIEDAEERERLGKAPVGLVKLKFSTENGSLRISVRDDGRGIDTRGILENAKKQGRLERSLSDYSPEEAYSLMLESGVTTTEIPNDYSGRGVGMDVIAHTVKELGGKLKITSRPYEGTMITMKF